MNDWLQNILVGIIVAAAVGYVVRRAWRLLAGRSTGTCGRCCACPAQTANMQVSAECARSEHPQLYTLTPPADAGQ